MHEFGCEECGGIGWTRDGEAVIAAGEENGIPCVKYVEVEQDGPRGAVWVGDCGHPVRPGSPLELFLKVALEEPPIPLIRNG